MFFHCLVLDELSRELCTINALFGLCWFDRLRQGAKVSSDLAQAVIEEIVQDINVNANMDNCMLFTNKSFEHHVDLIDKLLTDTGMKCNPLKCAWEVQETSFLGYWMTPTAIKPMKKNVDAILKINLPRRRTQVRSFIGAVNYYRSLWPCCAHFMKLLLELTSSKVNFQWNVDHQKAFETLKSIMATDCLNAYPNYNQPFEIYTNASEYQLGAAIIQNGRHIA